MTKEKVTPIKKEEKQMIELTNGEINLFMMHPGIKKLTESSNMKNKVKLRLFRFIIQITESDASKALQKMTTDLVEKHKENNPDAEPLLFNDPIFEDIFEQKSGLKIELFKVRVDELPSDITVQDMLMLKPFFNIRD